MIIQRDILDEIKPFIKRKEFLAIVGPRQSGKTTFLNILSEYLKEELKVGSNQIQLFTFEDQTTLAAFEAEPVRFVEDLAAAGKTTYLLIDEFQYIRQGGQKLKLIFDTVAGLKIIITGSSSLDLKASVGKYMVGRLVSFQLNPFSFSEFLTAQSADRWQRIYRRENGLLNQIVKHGKKANFGARKVRRDLYQINFTKLLEEYCTWGGYPAVVLARSAEEKTRLLRNIYSIYVLKDIKGLLELATDRELLRLSEFLATQAGNILVYKNLSNISGLDFRAVKKHLNILEETFIIKLLTPYFRNKQKELSKNPKVYFYDLGFRNHLVNNFNPLAKRSDAGALIENYVLLRLHELLEVRGRINFWRAKSEAEVDFIVERQGELLPIEVKYSEFDRPAVSRSLSSFIKTYRPSQALVLNKNLWARQKLDGCLVYFAPVYYL